MATEVAALGLLAGTLGPGARVFHVGLAVPQLESAVASFTDVLGVAFTPPGEVSLDVQTPDGSSSVDLRFVYSTRGAHVELTESVAGTVWDADSASRGHHIGVWSDDPAAEAARLEALGLPAVAWSDDAATGARRFSYHATPFGIYVELVDAAARAFYPDWFRSADPEA